MKEMGYRSTPMIIFIQIIYIYYLQLNTIFNINLVHADYLLVMIYRCHLSVPYSWLPLLNDKYAGIVSLRDTTMQPIPIIKGYNYYQVIGRFFSKALKPHMFLHKYEHDFMRGE